MSRPDEGRVPSISIVAETVPETELEQVRDQLPGEFNDLFELVGEVSVD